jgi:integrase
LAKSFDIKIWAIRERADRQRGVELRWKVGEKSHSATFETKTLADNRRAELMVAVQRGEAFDTETGLPVSELREHREVSWYQHARNYIEMKWQDAPAKTCRTLAEAMATVTPALVRDTRGMADVRTVRSALYGWAFNKHRWDVDPPDDVREVLAWFEAKSLPTSDLADLVVTRRALDALKRKLDGTTASPHTIRRKRAIFHNAVVFALEANLLAENPTPRVSWSLPEPVEEELAPESVASPHQARALLRAAAQQGKRGRRLKAFFGCLYFAAARPAEAIALKHSQCFLPRRGWGQLRLQETRPRAGSAWTDSGEAHDRGGLKKRSRKTVRVVPIPPESVAMLRWHIDAYGTAPDGRLFRTLRDGVLQESGYGEVWAEARTVALGPEDLAAGLAGRPYDLRHAGLSTWLASGVDPQTVAKRAGHSVAVLFRAYAKFISNSDDAANEKISARLRAQGPGPS